MESNALQSAATRALAAQQLAPAAGLAQLPQQRPTAALALAPKTPEAAAAEAAALQRPKSTRGQRQPLLLQCSPLLLEVQSWQGLTNQP